MEYSNWPHSVLEAGSVYAISCCPCPGNRAQSRRGTSVCVGSPGEDWNTRRILRPDHCLHRDIRGAGLVELLAPDHPSVSQIQNVGKNQFCIHKTANCRQFMISQGQPPPRVAKFATQALEDFVSFQKSTSFCTTARTGQFIFPNK